MRIYSYAKQLHCNRRRAWGEGRRRAQASAGERSKGAEQGAGWAQAGRRLGAGRKQGRRRKQGRSKGETGAQTRGAATARKQGRKLGEKTGAQRVFACDSRGFDLKRGQRPRGTKNAP